MTRFIGLKKRYTWFQNGTAPRPLPQAASTGYGGSHINVHVHRREERQMLSLSYFIPQLSKCNLFVMIIFYYTIHPVSFQIILFFFLYICYNVINMNSYYSYLLINCKLCFGFTIFCVFPIAKTTIYCIMCPARPFTTYPKEVLI